MRNIDAKSYRDRHRVLLKASRLKTARFAAFLTPAMAAASLVIAFAQPSPQPGQPQEPDTAQFAHLEEVWNEAHLRGDVEALDALWADDLTVMVPGMTPMTKGEVIGFAKSGRMAFTRYETSELRVRVYGDAAVVTGRLVRSRTINGQPREDDWRFTKLYIRRDARWQVVAFQASMAAP